MSPLRYRRSRSGPRDASNEWWVPCIEQAAIHWYICFYGFENCSCFRSQKGEMARGSTLSSQRTFLSDPVPVSARSLKTTSSVHANLRGSECKTGTILEEGLRMRVNASSHDSDRNAAIGWWERESNWMMDSFEEYKLVCMNRNIWLWNCDTMKWLDYSKFHSRWWCF